MVRQITTRAWETYRRHFGEIIAISAMILVPGAMLSIGAQELVAEVTFDGTLADIVRLATKVALSGVGYFLIAGVITEIVVADRRGRPSRGLRRTITTLPFATLIAVDLIVTASISAGLELFVIPGLIIAARFALAPVVVEIEHQGVRDALRRSFALSHHRSIAVLAVLVATLALTYLLALPLKSLGGTLLPAVPADMLGLLLAGILVKPLGAVMEVELALDLIDAEARPRTGAPAQQG